MNNHTSQRFWLQIAKYGFICGLSILYVCLVGMVEAFDRRDIIDGVISLGKVLIVLIALGLGYVSARKLSRGKIGQALIAGLGTGVIGSLMGAIFIWLTQQINVRAMFVSASPGLIKVLTFSYESLLTGTLIFIAAITGLSLIGAVLHLIPLLARRFIVYGLGAVFSIGMLEELLDTILSRFELSKSVAQWFFGSSGLSPKGAIAIFLVIGGIAVLWRIYRDRVQETYQQLPDSRQQNLRRVGFALVIIFLLLLPPLVGPYISQILVLVGLYTLMGLGLNIEIGLAGLLDLGFVGFFAIGAYTVAILTSTGDLGLSTVLAGEATHTSYTSFWVTVPLAVLISALAGVFLGIPVLRMRGDYLAIVTLGFAEIIRILVLSNFLGPLLGGAQGVLNIPKPQIPFMADIIEAVSGWTEAAFLVLFSPTGTINDPGHFYYLIIIGCALIAFIAWRLQNARVGRNWMAMREDEDVAEAMGINLIANKLLAFGIGAAFAGLSGAIFAAQIGSVFPHSFALLVSVNVVCLVIVGGAGSIPGVVVGSLVLVGLPELLREFAEFRLLIYGALLIVMMLVKPEGLWPSEINRREFEEEEPDHVPVPATPTARTAQ